MTNYKLLIFVCSVDLLYKIKTWIWYFGANRLCRFKTTAMEEWRGIGKNYVPLVFVCSVELLYKIKASTQSMRSKKSESTVSVQKYRNGRMKRISKKS